LPTRTKSQCDFFLNNSFARGEGSVENFLAQGLGYSAG
jgi:hypothetical protein